MESGAIIDKKGVLNHIYLLSKLAIDDESMEFEDTLKEADAIGGIDHEVDVMKGRAAALYRRRHAWVPARKKVVLDAVVSHHGATPGDASAQADLLFQRWRKVFTAVPTDASCWPLLNEYLPQFPNDVK